MTSDQLPTDQDQQDQWSPCPTGQISNMVKRINRSERRQRLRQLATTGALSLALFAVGAIVVGGFVMYQEPHFGGIGCTECLSHAAAYHDHVTGTAPMKDLELAGRIEAHMKQCICCRAKFNIAYPDAKLAALGMERQPWQPPLLLAVQISPSY